MVEDAPNDQDLVRRCLSRDEDAWRMLIRRYQRRVYNLCYQFFGRQGRAEDMAQEVFVKLYGSLNRYNSQMEFSTWLMAIARHLCIDFYRQHKKEKTVNIEEIASLPAPVHDGPAAALERGDAHRRLHHGLLQISEDLRMAVVLRDIQGYSYEEIAGILDAPLGTVKSRINRGRLELARVMRPVLAPQGGTT